MAASTFLEVELTLCQVLCANIWQTFLPCGHWPLERINYAPRLLLSPHCMELAPAMLVQRARTSSAHTELVLVKRNELEANYEETKQQR